MNRSLVVRCLAEAAGTAVLVFVGTGAIVAGALRGGVDPAVLAVAWFLAVAVPVLLFARVSGAHINPAVTLALVVVGRFDAAELPAYVGAQVGGAFVGSGLVGLVVGTGAHWGATLPWHGDLLLVALLEPVFTFALVAAVFYLTKEGRAPTNVELLLPAVVVGLSTYLIGPWTGSSLNPARTLAPAVLSGATAGIWVYFLAVTAAAAVAGLLVRKRG